MSSIDSILGRNFMQRYPREQCAAAIVDQMNKKHPGRRAPFDLIDAQYAMEGLKQAVFHISVERGIPVRSNQAFMEIVEMIGSRRYEIKDLGAIAIIFDNALNSARLAKVCSAGEVDVDGITGRNFMPVLMDYALAHGMGTRSVADLEPSIFAADLATVVAFCVKEEYARAK